MLWSRCSPSENGSKKQDCSVSTRPIRLIARELCASAVRAEKRAAAGIAMLCFLGLVFKCPAQGQETAPIRRSQIVHSFRLTKFYDTPEPLPAGKPGDLIRSVDFDQYDLPGDVSAVRILYHSRSAKGEDIATSGVVLFPDKRPPTGGWPVIAWAHDLNGVARDCAPSLARNLRSGSFLTMYVELGYAVVATDYAGLGTKYRNAFADMTSNASDVIYSIPAARAAVPQIGSRWIAMGTDEGGMAVLGVAEAEHDMRDPNYLGSITISRLTDLEDDYEALASLSYKSPLFLAYGIQTINPQFQATDILSLKALALYKQLGDGCSEGRLQPEPSAPDMLKANWKSNPLVQGYFSRNRAGLKPSAAPLLVIETQADADSERTRKVVDRLCKQGDRVELETYPENDPGSLIGDSVREQIRWIEGQFSGRAARNDCPSSH
jgi:hypothetical protein